MLPLLIVSWIQPKTHSFPSSILCSFQVVLKILLGQWCFGILHPWHLKREVHWQQNCRHTPGSRAYPCIAQFPMYTPSWWVCKPKLCQIVLWCPFVELYLDLFSHGKLKAKKPKAKQTSHDNGLAMWLHLTNIDTSQYSQEPKAPRATISSAISSSNGWATMSFSDTPEASMILSQHKGWRSNLSDVPLQNSWLPTYKTLNAWSSKGTSLASSRTVTLITVWRGVHIHTPIIIAPRTIFLSPTRRLGTYLEWFSGQHLCSNAKRTRMDTLQINRSSKLVADLSSWGNTWNPTAYQPTLSVCLLKTPLCTTPRMELSFHTSGFQLICQWCTPLKLTQAVKFWMNLSWSTSPPATKTDCCFELFIRLEPPLQIGSLPRWNVYVTVWDFWLCTK